MTKAKGWMFVALVATGGTLAVRGCTGCLSSSGGDPDDKLAGQFDDLCSIAKGGAKDPVKGVRKLGRYLVDHSGDMLKNFGDTFALIETIKDDTKHDARAHRARATWVKMLRSCDKPWNDFGEAIENNEEALGLAADAAERLDRTFQIIFGENARLDLRTLPADLERALTLKLR